MLEKLDFFNSFDYLAHMAVGMLGVFLIIGVIIGATYAVNYFCNKSNTN